MILDRLASAPLYRQTAKLARPPLESIRAHLPSSLQGLFPFSDTSSTTTTLNSLRSSLPSPAVQYLDSLPPSVALTTFLALVLTIAILLSPRRMASWRDYLGGRYSPFTSTAPGGGAPPRVTEADYHYLGPDDIVDPPRDSHGYRHHQHPDDDASHPDILILKHRGTTYPLQFPAYTIGEGILRVGELRRYAAEKTGTSDPRRIKLLYKGRVLKDDAVACCEEGLKQNSELMCVVSETAPRGPGGRSSAEDSESASEDDFAHAGQSRRTNSAADEPAHGGGVRVNVDGTLIDDAPRGPRRAHRGEGSSARRADRDANGHLSAAPTAAGTAATSATPTPSASPKPQGGPKTPHEKLDDITSNLRSKWVPMVEQYIASPPKDRKARQNEYTRLSESILAQVLLKLDDIITDGDTDLRTRRKAMIVETQQVLTRLDAVGKGPSA